MPQMQPPVHVRVGEGGHELGQRLPLRVELGLRLVGLDGVPLGLHPLLDVAGVGWWVVG